MFEGLFQPMHLLLILLIAMVLFGGKKLPELGKGLGQAIRGFKTALHEGEPGDDQQLTKQPPESEQTKTKT
jgi:sec-independent protein translocase protein TatA